MNYFIFAALMMLFPLNSMNMEYIKKYFVVPAPIHEVPTAPLKAKIGIIHIPNSFESIQIQKTLVL